MTPTQLPANLTYLLGDGHVSARALPIFSDVSCAFLAALSVHLRHDPQARDFPDIQTFAFWCRRGNVEKVKKDYLDGHARLGRGIVFHIAPSNVPINAAYSFAFALLAGNASLVRVASRETPQISIILAALTSVLAQTEFAPLRDKIAFVRYPSDSIATAQFSATCDARVIWGGDATVCAIRSLPLPPRAVELVFPDRYSLCVMNADAVVAAGEDDITKLAEGFYNDTYLMDQNACSSPHLVVWLGQQTQAAKQRLWRKLQEHVDRHYALAAVQAVDKYTLLLEQAATDSCTAVQRFGNEVYTLELKTLPPTLEDLRGKFGLFYDYDAETLDSLAPLVTSRFQTLTFYGMDKNMLADFVIANGLRGIDRIVPVGQALDIGAIWDGVDIIRQLSRIVDVR